MTQDMIANATTARTLSNPLANQPTKPSARTARPPRIQSAVNTSVLIYYFNWKQYCACL